VRKKAEELDLDIYFLFLPPYSPDLNPIEFLCKSVKKAISLKFIKTIEEFKAIIKAAFQKFNTSIS
jgi:transposase